MGLLSRRKGKSFEREVAIAFRRVYPGAKRTLTQQRDSGEAPDIQIPGWWVEAKSHKRVPIRKAFDQAVDEIARAKSTDKPVAVTKDNACDPLATMDLEDFISLLNDNENLRTEFQAMRAEILSLQTQLADLKSAPLKVPTVQEQLKGVDRVVSAFADWQKTGK